MKTSLRPVTLRASAALTVLLLLVLLSIPARACSICGCSLTSDWGLLGFGEDAGLLAGLRFESIEQNNLRSGTGSVATEALTFPNTDEIQLSTISRNVWLDLDWNGGNGWGVGLQVPFHNRSHRTIVDGDTTASGSQASGLGDVRVSARREWTGPGRASSLAVQLGLMLPTGRFDQTFATGPQAGTPLDRGLQLGTGTTDLLAALSYFRRPANEWGWFAQATLMQPLNTRDGFRPSPSLAANLGVRRLTAGRITPQLQFNARWDGREAGAASDRANSGGTFLALSPGLTIEAGRGVSAYAIVQLPVWQRVNGLQLEPRWLLSTGVRWQF